MRTDIPNKRICDIEVRRTPDGYTYPYEIVKWDRNPYFNRYDDYEYNPKTDMYRSKQYDWYHISKSLLEREETCYVLAWVTEDTDILSVGGRPWELANGDLDNYNDIVRYIYEENNKQNDE